LIIVRPKVLKLTRKLLPHKYKKRWRSTHKMKRKQVSQLINKIIRYLKQEIKLLSVLNLWNKSLRGKILWRRMRWLSKRVIS
jgi:hypothetical protein